MEERLTKDKVLLYASFIKRLFVENQMLHNISSNIIYHHVIMCILLLSPSFKKLYF